MGTWVAVSKETFIELYVNISTTSPLSPTEEKDASTLLREFVEPAVIDQAGYLLIALGAFIFIISFLGYCGSIKESRVLLTAYGIFLLIIFCLQVRQSVKDKMIKCCNSTFADCPHNTRHCLEA